MTRFGQARDHVVGKHHDIKRFASLHTLGRVNATYRLEINSDAAPQAIDPGLLGKQEPSGHGGDDGERAGHDGPFEIRI